MSASSTTHEVSNQPPPLVGHNRYLRHHALREAVVREGAAWADDEIAMHGQTLGDAAWIRCGEDAERNPPKLQTHDRYGNRLDIFEYHPAWHECLAWLKAQGVDTGAWADPRPGAHVRRAALFQLFAEVEPGALCPTTMTYGAVPAVSREAALAAWLPGLLSRDYDPRFIPAAQKHGLMMGMGMTEKQGGSDVRANTTRAEPTGEGGWYRLRGHKWFFSAPMCDAFLVTAQAPGGLSCFLLPRFAPDGSRTDIRIQRAKDKCGDRSNAGSEVEFWDAYAHRVGEEGRGVPTVIEMATYTRLDCANGSAGTMRAALAQALHHASHRRAFGAPLIRQPLMQNVLADLALEVEGHVALALRLARAFDRHEDEAESVIRRVLTPAAKYWVCKRAAAMAAEAMEVLGGNGYVEDSGMPRLYRQMPLNSIWEGSGNIMCLDVLRALQRTPRAAEVLAAEFAPACGRHAHFDRALAELQRWLAEPAELEMQARALVERLALLAEAALLIRHAPDFVATAFCQSRLGDAWHGAFGCLPRNAACDELIARAWPAA